MMEDKTCTGRKPIISVNLPPVAEPRTEPTPNKMMIKPASVTDLCKLWVTNSPINGTDMLPNLLNSITKLNNQVSLLSPLNDVL
jgi:hypothetical protein